MFRLVRWLTKTGWGMIVEHLLLVAMLLAVCVALLFAAPYLERDARSGYEATSTEFQDSMQRRAEYQTDLARRAKEGDWLAWLEMIGSGWGRRGYFPFP